MTRYILSARSLCLGLFSSRFIGKQQHNNTYQVCFFAFNAISLKKSNKRES